MRSRTDRQVCWLRVVDECSGAVLRTAVFPPRPSAPGRGVGHPGPIAAAFGRRGRPGRSRVDDGVPRASPGELPTDLALWPIGPGVGVIYNPPTSPQDNGVVERSQGTAKRWGEPQSCDDAGELQARLEEMDAIRREEYPSVKGRSRLEAFPDLTDSGRPYTAAWGEANRSLAAVATHLAGHAVRRRVDMKGSISLYTRRHYVGVIHKGKSIWIMFDPEGYEWVFADEDGRQLGRRSAIEIDRETIMGLTVTYRR